MSDRPILLILDTSAITAFTAGSIAVGEVMGEVADEQDAVGLPALCLAEAAQSGAGADMLDVLVGNPVTTVVNDDPGEWRTLAVMFGIVGGLSAASVACAAIDSGADILTRTPELYADLDGGGPIIAF